MTYAAFYRFTALAPASLPSLRDQLIKRAGELEVLGLIILAPEGLNATLSGSDAHLKAFVSFCQSLLGEEALEVKWSQASQPGFKGFAVKVRPEIVTLKRTDLVPTLDKSRHLSPDEWRRRSQDSSVRIVDARNNYEVTLGRFKGAEHLNIDEFAEFTDKLRAAQWDPKATYLIYCTGGIRCEKAALAMQEQGFKEVYQLDGGILNYLEKFPEGDWQGECFVFDHRIAVDSQLRASQTLGTCPHCGQPGKLDEKVECILCGTRACVCSKCLQAAPWLKTCSKNCAHHKRHGHDSSHPQV